MMRIKDLTPAQQSKYETVYGAGWSDCLKFVDVASMNEAYRLIQEAGRQENWERALELLLAAKAAR